MEVSATLLAAHALPPEYAGRPDAYIDYIVDVILPAAASEGLAEAVDAFCESVGFSPAQTRRVFEAARAHGLKIKGHVEQLSNLHGAELVAEFGGWSADHVEYLDAAGVAALKAAGTVAVLLPGAFYFLRETQKPPVELLRAAGVPMAVSTDLNPGTSPFASIRLAMNQACVLFGLTRKRRWPASPATRRRLGPRRQPWPAGRRPGRRLAAVGHRFPGRDRLRSRRQSLRQRVFRGVAQHMKGC